MTAPLPPNESERLLVLDACGILDGPADQALDQLVALAARLCAVPVALVSLVGPKFAHYKARFGLAIEQSPRAHAFCAHAINQPAEILEIEDARLDPRFSNSSAPFRFYAGAPLVTHDGYALGTLCVLDHVPRRLAATQRQALRTLAHAATGLIDFRRNAQALVRAGAARNEIEHSLRSVEEINRRVVENSGDCIKLLDLDGRLLFMNESGKEQLAICDFGEFIGKPWLDFWRGADHEAAARALESARAGKVGSFTGFFATPTGDPRWWDVIVTSLRDAQNRPERLLVISRDVTERIRADEALQLAGEKYRRIVTHAAIGIFETSVDGCCTTANLALARIYGYQDVAEFLAAAADVSAFYLEVGRRDEFKALIADRDEVTNFESRARRKDGAVIWIRETVQAVRDGAGALTHYEGVIEDITSVSALARCSPGRSRFSSKLWPGSRCLRFSIRWSTWSSAKPAMAGALSRS